MADLETIRIPVDASDFPKAVAQSEKLERTINKLYSALNTGKINSGQFKEGLRQLNSQNVELFGSVQKTTYEIHKYAAGIAEAKAATLADKAAKEQLLASLQSARIAINSMNAERKAESAAAREQAAADKALASEKQNLIAKYNPVIASMQLYAREQANIKRAAELKIITEAQEAQQLARLKTQYDEYTQGIARAGNIFENGATRSTRSMNAMGMATQQVGYQVGDFLVQVQSGTNWMVAFGQQATQAVGVLGIMNPALIGVGAALGIIIPLVTAVGAAWMKHNEALEKAKDKSESLVEIQKELSKTSSDLSTKMEMLRFGVDTESEADGLKKILDLTRQIEEKNKEWRETDSLGTRQRLAEEAIELKNQLSVLQKQVDEIRVKREQYEKAKAINEQMLSVELAHARAIGDAEEKARALAGVNIVDGILLARDRARELADAMGVTLRTAKALVALADQVADVGLSGQVNNGGDIPQAYGLGYLGGLPPELVGSQGGLAPSTSQRPTAAPHGIGGVDWGYKDSGGGRGSAGREATQESRLQGFLSQTYDFLAADNLTGQGLENQLEQEQAAYDKRIAQLEAFLQKKQLTQDEYNKLEKSLTERHEQDVALIRQQAQNQQLNDMGGFFGAMASAMQTGGDKMVKVASVFSAAQSLINAWTAYTEMLKDPSFIGRPWARFAAAASVLAAGLNAVRAIKSVGSGGGSSSGGGSASRATSTVDSTSTSSPQTVYLSGFTADQLFTGEQLQNLFDSIYKENSNRGNIFVVAR